MKRAAAGSVGSCGTGEPLPRSHVGERGPQARDSNTKRIATAIQPSNAPEHADGRARSRSLRISTRSVRHKHCPEPKNEREQIDSAIDQYLNADEGADAEWGFLKNIVNIDRFFDSGVKA